LLLFSLFSTVPYILEGGSSDKLESESIVLEQEAPPDCSGFDCAP